MLQKKIKSINFGILRPDNIRKMSTIRIVTPDTYDDDGYPIEGGLMDLHLGVIDPGLRCKSCGGRMINCSGHFGHIELIRPVIHVGYVKMVYTLLKTTCKCCGRLLLSKEEIAKYRDLLLAEEDSLDAVTIKPGADAEEATEKPVQVAEELGEEGARTEKPEGEESFISEEDHSLEIIEKTKKAGKCPHCGEAQENVKILKPTTFFEGTQRLLPSEIRSRLEKTPDSDLEIIGINPGVARPEWTVLTVLPVPPVTTRPSITLETGERSEDDLTHKLVDILRINQRLRDNISAGSPQLIIEDLWDLLQYHVNTYFNNEISGIPPARHRSGRPLKTLAQRLKGKEGRFRYNLSGKRVNFCARTVVSPDPMLSINEVGVPQAIAEELTTPEYVTEWNIDSMKKYIEAATYPKAEYIIKPDGRRKKLTEVTRADILTEIEPGYIIERQIKDGDVVLFNRQPSLHRMSIMAHKVRVLPGKTFRLNPAVCKPYNADFDGDEMNLHVPQTEESKAEAMILMYVQEQIISPRNGKPVIVGDEDYVTASYIMTRKGQAFNKAEAESIMLAGNLDPEALPAPDAKREGADAWSGKILFSLAMPKATNLSYKNKLCKKCATCKGKDCEYDSFVSIENGKLKTGAMDKEGFQGQVVDTIFRQSGPAAAASFLDVATNLATRAMGIRGFTTSAQDSRLDPATYKEIDAAINSAIKDLNTLIARYHENKLDRLPGKTLEQTLEDNAMAILGKARHESGNIAGKHLDVDNAAMIMTRVGARGSTINVTQMSACVGQQAVRGARIIRGYRKKTLPHFKEGDIGAEARGFVKSSFMRGLTPLEYFFHAMGGREGLVDKGIRTSKSGYMQRRLINALQDLVLKDDGTVRDAAGTVVQFVYGEDGVEPMQCYQNEAFKKVVK